MTDVAFRPPGHETVWFVDQATNERVSLTPRQAASAIVVLTAELAACGYELHKLHKVAAEYLAGEPSSARRLRVALADADPFTRDIDPRTRYPEAITIQAVLDMAGDSECYAEHVESLVLPFRTDEHKFDDNGDPFTDECHICFEGRMCMYYLHAPDPSDDDGGES